MASRMINPQSYVPPSTIAVQAEMWRVGSGSSAVSYKHGVLRGWDRDASECDAHGRAPARAGLLQRQGLGGPIRGGGLRGADAHGHV